VLAAGAVVVAVASIGVGAFAIRPDAVLAILLERLGVQVPMIPHDAQQESLLLGVRLPRTVLAAVVGAALGISGAAYQGLFRNPLASPSVLGISGGAAAGAAIAIVAGLNALLPPVLAPWALAAAAFVGALITSWALYRFARHGGRTAVTTLLLAGVAVNAIAGAVVSLMTFLADDPALRSIVFWQLGSVSGATWPFVAAATVCVTITIALLIRQGRNLNLLVLGDAEARHLGVDTERVRRHCMGVAALAVAAATAVAGIVAFVGLIAPHLVRLLVGPDHRMLLPASALGGATLVMLADLLARTVVSPAQLPLGLLTSLIGGPYFLYLIERTRREHGAWL